MDHPAPASSSDPPPPSSEELQGEQEGETTFTSPRHSHGNVQQPVQPDPTTETTCYEDFSGYHQYLDGLQFPRSSFGNATSYNRRARRAYNRYAASSSTRRTPNQPRGYSKLRRALLRNSIPRGVSKQSRRNFNARQRLTGSRSRRAGHRTDPTSNDPSSSSTNVPGHSVPEFGRSSPNLADLPFDLLQYMLWKNQRPDSLVDEPPVKVNPSSTTSISTLSRSDFIYCVVADFILSYKSVGSTDINYGFANMASGSATTSSGFNSSMIVDLMLEHLALGHDYDDFVRLTQPLFQPHPPTSTDKDSVPTEPGMAGCIPLNQWEIFDLLVPGPAPPSKITQHFPPNSSTFSEHSTTLDLQEPQNETTVYTDLSNSQPAVYSDRLVAHSQTPVQTQQPQYQNVVPHPSQVLHQRHPSPHDEHSYFHPFSPSPSLLSKNDQLSPPNYAFVPLSNLSQYMI